jgi:hypothetical protein
MHAGLPPMTLPSMRIDADAAATGQGKRLAGLGSDLEVRGGTQVRMEAFQHCQVAFAADRAEFRVGIHRRRILGSVYRAVHVDAPSIASVAGKAYPALRRWRKP